MRDATSMNGIDLKADANHSDMKADRWAKAMARYRAAQAALAPFEKKQDLIEEVARAAKRALDEVAIPDWVLSDQC